MNYKYFFIILLFIISACSTSNVTNNKVKPLNKSKFQNKGFALVYSDNLYKEKIVSKKLDHRGLIIWSNDADNFGIPLITPTYIIPKIISDIADTFNISTIIL